MPRRGRVKFQQKFICDQILLGGQALKKPDLRQVFSLAETERCFASTQNRESWSRNFANDDKQNIPDDKCLKFCEWRRAKYS